MTLKHKCLKTMTALLIAAIVCLSVSDNYTIPTEANSISELEAKIQSNNAAVEQKNRQLEQLQLESSDVKAYIMTLGEKVTLQKENINIFNEKLYALDTELAENEYNLSVLEKEIAQKQAEIDDNIAIFRKRLRYMYMNNDTSIASILAESSDFYDFLARREIMVSMADYDQQLIENLKSQIAELESQNAILEQQRQNLLEKQNNVSIKRDILQGEMNGLIDEYMESHDYVDELIATSTMTMEDIEWLNAENARMDTEIQTIREQERIEAEKARKDAEERRKRLLAIENGDYSHEVYTGDRAAMIEYAKTYLGVYYQWCGNYPAKGYYGLDCSHFTYRVYEHYGLMSNYMDSRVQQRYCNPISREELQPGDLVFYKDSGGTVRHVTMYIGNGQIIGANGGDSWVDTLSEAQDCNAKVKIVSLNSDHRTKVYGRVPGMN